MTENIPDTFPTDQLGQDALMDEFLKVWGASHEYMTQYLGWRLWDAGRAAQQLEQYLRDQGGSDEPLPNLKS